MARIDKRTTSIRLEYKSKDLNEAYRAICSLQGREVAEMMDQTNRHNKEITIHSVMSLCKIVGAKFHADFAEETIEIITHKDNGAPIVLKEGPSGPEETHVNIEESGRGTGDDPISKEIIVNEDEEEEDPF